MIIDEALELPDVPILSDLDGTLIDSTASVVAAFRWWADRRGLPADVVERIPFGRTAADAVSVLAPALDAAEEGRVLDDRQASHTEGVVALDGAAALLASHRQLAIVTSCPLRLAKARLAAAGLPVPRVLVTPESWSRGKPDPEPYLQGAERLGVPASSCIVLEDAPPGVESGKRAGMRVIALLTTHDKARLAAADCLIESLRDLRSALASLGVR